MENKTLENLEGKCLWWGAVRNQAWNEFLRGDGFEGTEGQEDRGCFSCDGYNEINIITDYKKVKDCDGYFVRRKK